MARSAARSFAPAAAQLAYTAARARLDAAERAELTSELIESGDAEWTTAFDACRAAELELFAWARGRLETDPRSARLFGANAGDVDAVFAAAAWRSDVRERVVALCLALAPVA